MRRSLGILAVALGTATSMPLQAEGLANYLDGVRVRHGLPALAAAVVQDGAIVAAAAVGSRVAGHSIAVDIDDRFHIGSNTKAMTATLAGMLVDEGLLSWDSSVGSVLGQTHPGLSGSLAAATLRQLLSHSSGVPGDNDELLALYFSENVFDHNPDTLRAQLLEHWGHHEVTVPQGSPFQYSNLGYIIAGMMIETAAGLPWEQMIHERLFVPLRLTTAGLGAQASLGLIDAPVGHRIEADGSVTPMLWGPAADAPVMMGPAGNVHMSVRDYASWAAWNLAPEQLGPGLLSPETLAEIQAEVVQTPIRENPPPGTPGTGGYALGWGLVQFDWADHPLLTHNGSNGMNLARIVLDPRRELGVVVLTNFPGPSADLAAGLVLEALYRRYAN